MWLGKSPILRGFCSLNWIAALWRHRSPYEDPSQQDQGLQAFYITNLNRDKKNVVLVDARIAESANYRGRAGDPDFRRGSPCVTP